MVNTNKSLKSCTRCLLDSTVSEITFNLEGICNYCDKHDKLLKHYPQEESLRSLNFNNLVSKIKKSGRGKYDVIVGVQKLV